MYVYLHILHCDLELAEPFSHYCAANSNQQNTENIYSPDSNW